MNSQMCGEKNAEDWRLRQLMMNVLGAMQFGGRNPFFPEEDKMITYLNSILVK